MSAVDIAKLTLLVCEVSDSCIVEEMLIGQVHRPGGGDRMASLHGEKEKSAVFAKHQLAFRRRPALLAGQLGRELNRAPRCIEAVTLQTKVELLLVTSENLAALEVVHGLDEDLRVCRSNAGTLCALVRRPKQQEFAQDLVRQPA